MSFRIVEQCTPRLNRTELAVPGSSTKFFEKAAAGNADVILFDLEDSVAPADKEQARRNVIGGLRDIDWRGRGKTMSVRLNGLDTHYFYRDIVDVVEQAGDRLDMVMVPKIGTPSDVYAVDMLLTQIEAAKGFTHRIGIELLVESALGMQNINEIAAASKRIESLHLGTGDYAASTRARTTTIGGPNANYAVLTDADAEGRREFHWNDMWHYATARLVVAARANGLRPIDGPLANFSDPEGLKAAANRSATLGCEGKWAIHPSQIDPINELFTPSEKEVSTARRILEAMALATSEGRGAVALDGRMIDVASIKQAEVMVKKAEQIAARG